MFRRALAEAATSTSVKIALFFSHATLLDATTLAVNLVTRDRIILFFFAIDAKSGSAMNATKDVRVVVVVKGPIVAIAFLPFNAFSVSNKFIIVGA